MKTTTCSFLIFICLLQLMTSVNTQTIDWIVEKKIRDILKLRGDSYTAAVTSTLSCTNVKATGTLASCPTGMTATGCACGFACGSWNVQNENVCQCLCPITDWTMARCCKVG
ncbi:resistin-like alpha [Acomys russatus]|uniref:resistin-like alpha n=1 Tax=Acomys russatus TaxID=60746 RepID=UPI0021E25D42|nr:resistin-like alpha [Acomys russatus]